MDLNTATTSSKRRRRGGNQATTSTDGSAALREDGSLRNPKIPSASATKRDPHGGEPEKKRGPRLSLPQHARKQLAHTYRQLALGKITPAEALARTRLLREWLRSLRGSVVHHRQRFP